MVSLIADGLTVEYPIYDADKRSLRRAMLGRGRTGGRILGGSRENGHGFVVRAVHDVSFAFETGDRVALIGHNGAGKTTLLRALAGVYEPTAGRVLADGRLSPVFDVNPGLDLDDTGYENVVVNGLMLGLSPAEIRAKMPEIIEFTELGEYMHLPVRTLSAGMHVRLAFAISTAVDPEIILLDEGIASFDARFGAKAEKRLESFVGRSSILVLASHSEQLLRRLCNKGVLMAEGRVVAIGALDQILALYRAGVDGVSDSAGEQAQDGSNRG